MQESKLTCGDCLDSISVVCPAGSTVVSGGHFTSAGDFIHNAISRPYDNGWQAYFFNPVDYPSWTIRVYALCLSTEPAGVITTARKRG